MASPETHWQTAARTQRFVHVLIRSYTPARFPTIAIAAYFAATNFAIACLLVRSLRVRDDQDLYRYLRSAPDLSAEAVLMPYLYLRNWFLDALYLEQSSPWTREAAAAILEELQRLRDALEPYRTSTSA